MRQRSVVVARIARAGLAALRRHRATTAVAVGAFSAAAIAAAFLLASAGRSGQPARPSYANISRNFHLCLFTTTRDSAARGAAWGAVQQAKQKTAINAQQLTPPPGSASQLVPYLDSLVSLHCQLIITAGEDVQTATAEVATKDPQQPFVDIGGTGSLPNVTNIATLNATMSTTLQQLIAASATASPAAMPTTTAR
jgi:basic membrane lipoprotein Med (substrate-binding protein (PBP1-ABC) superfamily)